MLISDITKVFTTYQTFLHFFRNLNMFIKKKLKYFTRPKQISQESETRINLIIKQIAFLRTNRFLCGLKDFVTS